MRGCPTEWVRGLYNFAALPDMTFFFKASLEVSLQRILDGRPQLKYFEAGMDLHLSTDPYESFRIFQGRILEQYLAMSSEFNFMVIDANQSVEEQQNIVRELLSDRIDLNMFKGNGMFRLDRALQGNLNGNRNRRRNKEILDQKSDRPASRARGGFMGMAFRAST